MPPGRRRAASAATFARPWQAMFKDIDVIICPAMPTPAFPHDHSPKRTRGGWTWTARDQLQPAIGLCPLATVNGFPGNRRARRTQRVRPADRRPGHWRLPGRPDHDRLRRGIRTRELGGFFAAARLRLTPAQHNLLRSVRVLHTMAGRERVALACRTRKSTDMDGMPRSIDEHPIRFDLLTENPVYKPFRYPWPTRPG